jgi:hypothetical protein
MKPVIIFIGMLLAALGLLVKKFPMLLSGYNTMPASRRKYFDEARLTTFVRNSFIVMGLVLIAAYHIFFWMGYPRLAEAVIPVSIIGGAFIIIAGSQKYDHFKKKS